MRFDTDDEGSLSTINTDNADDNKRLGVAKIEDLTRREKQQKTELFLITYCMAKIIKTHTHTHTHTQTPKSVPTSIYAPQALFLMSPNLFSDDYDTALAHHKNNETTIDTHTSLRVIFSNQEELGSLSVPPPPRAQCCCIVIIIQQ